MRIPARAQIIVPAFMDELSARISALRSQGHVVIEPPRGELSGYDERLIGEEL